MVDVRNSVDNPLLALVLLGDYFPTSERWKAELAAKRKKIWYSESMVTQ